MFERLQFRNMFNVRSRSVQLGLFSRLENLCLCSYGVRMIYSIISLIITEMELVLPLSIFCSSLSTGSIPSAGSQTDKKIT